MMNPSTSSPSLASPKGGQTFILSGLKRELEMLALEGTDIDEVRILY